MTPPTTTTRSERRLLETMPPRAIDFHPRLARAIDALDALRDGDAARVFGTITARVREWAAHNLKGLG